jgi:hypothetical protein
LFIFLLVVCSAGTSRSELREPVSVDSGYVIPMGDLPAITASANQGDSQSAFRLSLHYGSDSGEGQTWQIRAAELGHPTAQYNEWFRLSQETDCASLQQALVWLEKAGAVGVDVQWEMEQFLPRTTGCQ